LDDAYLSTCIVIVSLTYQGSRVAFPWSMLVQTPYDSCVPHLEPCLEQEPLMEHGDGSPTHATCIVRQLLYFKLILLLCL